MNIIKERWTRELIAFTSRHHYIKNKPAFIRYAYVIRDGANQKISYIRRLVVAPKYRRNGYARKLLEHVIRNDDIVEIMTARLELEALLESAGFKTTIYRAARGTRLYGAWTK